jgi:hypothetical protein
MIRNTGSFLFFKLTPALNPRRLTRCKPQTKPAGHSCRANVSSPWCIEQEQRQGIVTVARTWLGTPYHTNRPHAPSTRSEISGWNLRKQNATPGRRVKVLPAPVLAYRKSRCSRPTVWN